ncbi:MAG: chorismate-binding protein [Verrucomicrobiota bacterium]|nr:chorismate-binding protein [Verrucomicrobiota bacterium]
MIYWRDREGNPPPSGAFFGRIPFNQKTLQLTPRNSITSLPSPSRYKVVSDHYIPNKKEWCLTVETALKARIPKVVLARRHVLELEETPDPLALLAALQPRSEGAYLFCWADANEAFLGASPERLFCREGDLLHTEAIAGTLPKTALTSLFGAKEEKEWRAVETFLQTALSPFAFSSPHFSSRSIHTTYNLQHLYSSASILLRSSISTQTLLAHLHPTPALLGTPRDEALSFLTKHEKFSRNFYGGIIGWEKGSSSEWIVAIRSCHVTKNILSLYTGAGIVEGSDPEKEWEELNQKEKLYEGLFQ